MLLEHQDAKKLVKVLARKMLERRSLAQWRKLAYETKDISCGDLYSPGNDRLSGSDYTRALNRMHFAVNGVKPYAEGGGGGGGGISPSGNPRDCGNPYAQTYGTAGTYDVCSCESEGYAPRIPCATPDPWHCPESFECPDAYKCSSDFRCGSGFTCGGVYWQRDDYCATSAPFRCPDFICEAGPAGQYGCHEIDIQCVPAQFACQQTFGCFYSKECPGPTAFVCDAAGEYNCPTGHDCLAFTCAVDFDCGEMGGQDNCVELKFRCLNEYD